MSQIYLSSSDLFQTASQLKTTNADMDSNFSTIRSQMHAMSASWQSPAGEKCLQEFESFAPAFEQFTALIDAYIVYLNQTAQSYQENESLLSGGA